MAEPNRSDPGPGLPYWPFNCLALYTQMARDVGRYAQAMTACTDTMEAVHVEGELGASLFHDLMKGYYDLALAPWAAMAAIMVERAADGEPAPETAPPQSESESIRSRRRGN